MDQPLAHFEPSTAHQEKAPQTRGFPSFKGLLRGAVRPVLTACADRGAQSRVEQLPEVLAVLASGPEVRVDRGRTFDGLG